TPAGKAMFQMMGVFAEFERAMIVERVKSGLRLAKVRGTKSGKPIGRPRVPEGTRKAIREAYRAGGIGMRSLWPSAMVLPSARCSHYSTAIADPDCSLRKNL